MQPGLRLGRIGPLTIALNYTWIFVAILVLWWVALLWLPANYPSWPSNLYWLAAIAVLLLYVLSVIAHELVHTVTARTGHHHVYLFPFGAAVPFRMRDMQPGRALAAAVAAPLFNIVLGGILLYVGAATSGWLSALIIPIGWLNLWVGLINLIPGTPFDGGLALASAIYVFTNDRDGGSGAAQGIGRVATLLLVLVGAWQGLTSHMWLLALALVVVGWSANEAAAVGRQRRLLHGVLSQVRAADLMEPSRPGDVVQDTQSVAALVKAHPHFPPNTPLAVLDGTGSLEGVTTIAATESLLQGNWPTTPVRAITTRIDELEAVNPRTPLVDLLAVAQNRPADGSNAPDEEPNIAVLDGGRLVGSIDPNRLQTFEEAGRQFGMEEALVEAPGGKALGWLRNVASLIPVVIILAVMAILGNIALHTDPLDLKQPGTGTEGDIQFSNFRPADGDIVGLGPRDVSVQIEGPSAVVSATITLDGQILDTKLSGASPLTQTATAGVPGLTLGPHTARINAITDSGNRKSGQWRFRVSPSGGTGSGGTTGGAQPTPASSPFAALDTGRFVPAPGGRVLAGETVAISVQVTATQPLSSAKVLLDGKELDTKMEQVAGAGNLYKISATTPSVQLGRHTVVAEIMSGSGNRHSAEWIFDALTADAGHVYFKETGYFLTQPFLGYWQEHGGLALFGYPISDLLQETDSATGEVYTAQYFERARMEQHPSLGDQVVLGRLGALLHQPEPPAKPRDGYTFFSETGHNVSPTFLKYWNDNGGLAVFGYPIGEEHTEKNPIDGTEYTVQYFERNRFELHPEKAGTPFEVQLGLLGTELYRQKYGPNA